MAGQRVVVVGAGIVGASVAHHLTEHGFADVLVIDARSEGTLPGSTGLAPGLVGRLSSDRDLARLALDSVELYARRSGGFDGVGCLEVATSEAQLAAFADDVRDGAALGIEARVITAAEAGALAPGLVDDAAHGALFIPGDGTVDPVAVTAALIDSARGQGAQFRWNSPVRQLEEQNGRVIGVRLDNGVVRADTVVLAVGIWGPMLASTVGVQVPMVPVEHPYAFTTPSEDLTGEAITMPIVRYPEHAVYCRIHGTRYGFGTYDHEPVPAALGATAGRRFRDKVFEPALTRARKLVPALRTADVEKRINGVFALTPDELPLVGPVPEVRGLWLAEGSWVTHAGGVGKLLAEQLLGLSSGFVDPARLAPARFAGWSADRVAKAALPHYRGIYLTH
ncbi:NAD(P)/FAD-dependent oxidoreductase [Allokutzneria albata]|uniref:Sarcosine oxidase n=1 Tax=Allokutzneria albata TaxID=211114 RepID=A0A1G9URZ8_ALLAB|nr:FAD-dependent oxidoreductase [Allokutzneria albata]SDM62644.1 sarcosine oxidase [Allokutzneria albata]